MNEWKLPIQSQSYTDLTDWMISSSSDRRSDHQEDALWRPLDMEGDQGESNR